MKNNDISNDIFEIFETISRNVLAQIALFLILAQNTYLFLYIFTHHFLWTLLEYSEPSAGLILPLPAAIHFHFLWLTVFWRQTITWHMAAPSAVVEWFPLLQFKCATYIKKHNYFCHTVPYIDLVYFEGLLLFCFILFLLLPSLLFFFFFSWF